MVDLETKMGYRTTQRILECALCERTPDDGEYMWEMCGEHWCSDCCDKEEAPEIPEFAGTRGALQGLSVLTR